MKTWLAPEKSMRTKERLASLALCLASTPVAGCVAITDFEERTGETIWTVEDPALPEGRSVVALPDGGFVVGVGTSTNASVIRFDADGEQVWAQSAAFENRSFGGLALSPTGDVLVVGTIPIGEEPVIQEELVLGELWVGELSVEDGSEQWSAAPGIPLESTYGQAIAVDAEGGLRVAGFSNDFVALMAGLGPDGTLQWWQEAPEYGMHSARGTDILVLPDGSAVFVGKTGGGGPTTMWGRRIDAMGTEVWSASLGGPGSLGDAWASIERHDDDTLVVVGTSFSTGEGVFETSIVELDESGVQQHSHAWRGEWLGHAVVGTALASDGTIYMSTTNGLYGALDMHGEHLWSKFSSEGNVRGSARDTAILSDGNVVFVGSVGLDDTTPHLWIRKTEP
jgi:outer membrane protein assembly factor BamB